MYWVVIHHSPWFWVCTGYAALTLVFGYGLGMQHSPWFWLCTGMYHSPWFWVCSTHLGSGYVLDMHHSPWFWVCTTHLGSGYAALTLVLGMYWVCTTHLGSGYVLVGFSQECSDLQKQLARDHLQCVGTSRAGRVHRRYGNNQ